MHRAHHQVPHIPKVIIQKQKNNSTEDRERLKMILSIKVHSNAFFSTSGVDLLLRVEIISFLLLISFFFAKRWSSLGSGGLFCFCYECILLSINSFLCLNSARLQTPSSQASFTLFSLVFSFSIINSTFSSCGSSCGCSFGFS